MDRHIMQSLPKTAKTKKFRLQTDENVFTDVLPSSSTENAIQNFQSFNTYLTNFTNCYRPLVTK